jgi:outer membrane protein assembly factor BamB
VFVSTNLATYAVDLSTHKPVWSVPLVGKLALSKNGVLYIQSANKISAFNVK